MSALISGPVATRYGLLAPAGLSWPRLLLTTIISALAIALAALAGLSEREVALVALLPWLIYLGLQLPIVVRSMPWLAPWLALLLGQALHLVEHAVQMAQLHILQLPPSSAHGVVGALDIEWVHLIWNTFVLGATFCFWTVQAKEVTHVFTYGGDGVASYPLDIYRGSIRRFFTFVVPLAFVNYEPALFLLGRPDPLGLPAFARLLSPLAALIMALLARYAWRQGVQHYQSTGS